MEMFYWIFI
jgi:translation initiation factor 3 subunit A